MAMDKDELPSRKRPPIGRLHLLTIMAGVVTMGAVNFVLLKVLYTSYGDKRAFFVNQAINFLYIVYGGMILYPRMAFTNHVTSEMLQFPKSRFFVMGILDSLGTFFTCLGAPFTPGSTTPLLNQLLIPFTMLVSAILLKVHYDWKEYSGAGLIIMGACTSVVPNVLTAEQSDVRWYAVAFYALSNAPMALSACYKESKFDESQIDVWYLTQWVSIFQFLVSFAYMPLLVLPGFGSADGMPFAEVPKQFMDGFWCFTEQIPECAENSAFLLLSGYCFVNVCFNTLGLYLTKHGSAVLNSLSYSILLPFTTVLFFTPLLGKFQEPLSSHIVFTLTGLVLALLGFGIYQRSSVGVGPEAEKQRKSVKAVRFNPADETDCLAAPLMLITPLDDDEDPMIAQPSFQERVIGLAPVAPRVRANSQ